MTDLKQHAVKAHEDGWKARKAIRDNEWKEIDLRNKLIVWNDIGHELKPLMTFEEFCAQVTVKVDPLAGNSKDKLKSFDVRFPDAAQVRLLIKSSLFGRSRAIPIRDENKYQAESYFRDHNIFVFDSTFPTFLEALGRAYMEAAKVKK